MKRGWRVVLVIFLVLILLGAAAILVGYLTGADLSRIYAVLDNRYHFDAWGAYFQQVYESVLQALSSLGI